MSTTWRIDRNHGYIREWYFQRRRPQSGYYDDEIQQAAAVWESLSQNHPFIDGNKRTAFAVSYTFLLINKILVTADTGQIWQFLHRNYETGQMRYDVLYAWLQENTQQI